MAVNIWLEEAKASIPRVARGTGSSDVRWTAARPPEGAAEGRILREMSPFSARRAAPFVARNVRGGEATVHFFDYDGGVNVGPGFKVTPAVELVSLLGKGGMGDVWIADHAGLGARVVVKFLSRELTENEDALSRFKREAMSAAAVKSPHVVQVFDHGVTTNGLPFIVMELLEGRDLSHHIAKGPLPTADVVEIVTQVSRALSRAHQAGIVHRDIKPENIFLCETGDGELFVKLLDFGIAKAQARAGRATVTGTVVGTPYYMSPEQIVGAPADAKVDTWALAAVTFEALTGRVAFDGDTVGAITLAIHADPPVPSRILPSISPDIDAWFAKAFARSAADRFANAKELALALRKAARIATDDFREPMSSLGADFQGARVAGASSEPALPLAAASSKSALASTHLSSTMSLSSSDATRSASRSRALVVVVPLLLVALVVAAFGAWRARAGDTSMTAGAPPSASAPVLLASSPPPSSERLPELAPSSATPVASASPPPATPASQSKPAQGTVKPAALPAKPPAGKPKPGKYDDIQ